MVRKSPSPRVLSPKLHGSFLPKSDFETFGHTGRATEAFLRTWFFSGCFYQTRIPENATLVTKTFITRLIITILVAICMARAPVKAAAAHMKGFDRLAIAAAVKLSSRSSSKSFSKKQFSRASLLALGTLKPAA